MKRKISGKSSDIALKIDISKVYDCVDWGFVVHMMLRLGFDLRWVGWMIMCVSSLN